MRRSSSDLKRWDQEKALKRAVQQEVMALGQENRHNNIQDRMYEQLLEEDPSPPRPLSR